MYHNIYMETNSDVVTFDQLVLRENGYKKKE